MITSSTCGYYISLLPCSPFPKLRGLKKVFLLSSRVVLSRPPASSTNWSRGASECMSKTDCLVGYIFMNAIYLIFFYSAFVNNTKNFNDSQLPNFKFNPCQIFLCPNIYLYDDYCNKPAVTHFYVRMFFFTMYEYILTHHTTQSHSSPW